MAQVGFSRFRSPLRWQGVLTDRHGWAEGRRSVWVRCGCGTGCAAGASERRRDGPRCGVVVGVDAGEGSVDSGVKPGLPWERRPRRDRGGRGAGAGRNRGEGPAPTWRSDGQRTSRKSAVRAPPAVPTWIEHG
jgi:hypothetical protein